MRVAEEEIGHVLYYETLPTPSIMQVWGLTELSEKGILMECLGNNSRMLGRGVYLTYNSVRSSREQQRESLSFPLIPRLFTEVHRLLFGVAPSTTEFFRFLLQD